MAPDGRPAPTIEAMRGHCLDDMPGKLPGKLPGSLPAHRPKGPPGRSQLPLRSRHIPPGLPIRLREANPSSLPTGRGHRASSMAETPWIRCVRRRAELAAKPTRRPDARPLITFLFFGRPGLSNPRVAGFQARVMGCLVPAPDEADGPAARRPGDQAPVRRQPVSGIISESAATASNEE